MSENGLSPGEQKQADAWMDAVGQLPKPRQEAVAIWMEMQGFIVQNLGVPPDEWLGYVQWALENPFDYSFVEEFPDDGTYELTEDSATIGDATEAARNVVGSKAAKNVATGDGIQGKRKTDGIDKELFNRFMSQHMGTLKK
jgi:hypothetical protein